MPRQTAPVYGHTIAPPRITPGGLRVAMVRVALPFLAALTVIDLGIWAVARAFGACYGIWCWL